MYRVGLENNTEGRSQAWVLGHPGCFSYGVDGEAALQAVPQAILEYQRWIETHSQPGWITESGTDFQLEETWECFSITRDFELDDQGEEINAWFRHDWKPLTVEDIQHGLLLLGWSRQELLQTTAELSQEILDRPYPQERWSIVGILNHIGAAEWWYLDRLGLAFPRPQVPEAPFERLSMVRAQLVEVLPTLADKQQVLGISGEFWSPRKLLRRAVWHELDHITHIKKLL